MDILASRDLLTEIDFARLDGVRNLLLRLAVAM
jgi:hypothetical protein